MTSKNKFSAVLALLLVVILTVACSSDSGNENSQRGSNKEKNTAEESNETGFIKHLGFEPGTYDPATGKMGEFDFTLPTPELGSFYYEYGYEVPASTAGPAKKNPQPTFYLPLGTKVRSLVDGIVFDVPTLYSNDFSVMVQAEGSDLIFETEHVIKPTVKKGDKVKAGDVIGEVSDYDARYTPGLGLYEIGVLQGGNPPSHVCPTDYFHSSVKEELLKQLTDLRAAIEQHLNNPNLYDEAGSYDAGCRFKEKIEG